MTLGMHRQLAALRDDLVTAREALASAERRLASLTGTE